MHIAQGMPRAHRAGGASAARNGHRGRLGGVSAPSGGGWHGAGGRGQGGRAGGGSNTELEEGKLAEEGELVGAAELEAEEEELEGLVQHAMDLNR